MLLTHQFPRLSGRCYLLSFLAGGRTHVICYNHGYGDSTLCPSTGKRGRRKAGLMQFNKRYSVPKYYQSYFLHKSVVGIKHRVRNTREQNCINHFGRSVFWNLVSWWKPSVISCGILSISLLDCSRTIRKCHNCSKCALGEDSSRKTPL